MTYNRKYENDGKKLLSLASALAVAACLYIYTPKILETISEIKKTLSFTHT